MRILAEGVGKKFGNEWIIKNFGHSFESGKKYAVTGNNGSGKSTLLKLLSGTTSPNEGSISYYTEKGESISTSEIYREIAWVAPYSELIEEMKLFELLQFYSKFKPLSIGTDELVEVMNFEKHRARLVGDFSSGMKQRVQIGLAAYSDSEIILLDEPTSNLDKANSDWYLSLFEKDLPGKIVVVSSNQPTEYAFCDEVIFVGEFKKKGVL